MCGSFPGLLIGRTAVHSGKDPAFVAYDQFLSTGILQPLSRGRGPLWVKTGKAQMEHMFSGSAPKADMSEPCRHFRVVPTAVIAAVRRTGLMEYRQRIGLSPP